MLIQPVTRAEGISVRVIGMPDQLVGFLRVERAGVNNDLFYSKFEKL
jgi:hypothetical protein